MQRLQRYPLAHDQSVIITNVVSEDSGTYYCEYPVGVKLSTILVTVKGRLIALLVHFYFYHINYLLIPCNYISVMQNT